MPRKQGGAATKTKVFWSDLEKLKIVKRAVELQDANPALAGLSLIQEAIGVLPACRRRVLIAQSQAKWFRRMFADELKRREMAEQLKDDTVSVLKQHRDHVGAWKEEHGVWKEEQLARFDRMLPALERVARETEGHHEAFEKLAKQNEEWRLSSLEFNTVATRLLAETARVTREHAAKAEEWERLRQEAADAARRNQKEAIELLGRICGELHDLNLRLASVEVRHPKPPSRPTAEKRRTRG